MAEITFEAVFRDELAIISKRREAEGRAVINGTSGPHTSLGLTGLALSGGGVRSATFALGVVQALIAHGVFRHIDYLSTVSGGGYLGVCVSNWFAQAKASVDPPLLSSRGNSDPPAIAHLRDHASYLAPRGRSKLFTLIVSVGIGLFINVTLLLPILILLAILFQFYVSFLLVKMDHPFTYTVAGFSILALLYAIIISNFASARRQDLDRTLMLRLSIVVSVGITILAFLNIQQPIVKALYEAIYLQKIPQVYTWIAGGITVIGVFVSLLRTLIRIGVFVGLLRSFALFVTKFWRFALGLAAPLLVWYVVLMIEVTLQYPCAWLKVENAFGLDIMSFMRDSVWPLTSNEAIRHYVGCEFQIGGQPAFYFNHDVCRLALVYSGFSAILLLIALAVNVNSTSLNTFYRDRLQAAYLFEFAGRESAFASVRKRLGVNRGLRLSALSGSGPYHLINAAINIQASELNLRGRNADFFTFSKLYVGGETTGFCPTSQLERGDSKIDVATATAISGAAIAPNQGISTNNYVLRFFMTLGNARLGYWLVNPRRLAKGQKISENVSPYYFFLELFGKLNEKRRRVYVTNGGYIENLGLYQLLRRRCRFIIVCDAEWDPKREFHGLAHVIRLAQIDLGVKIDINLLDLRENQDGFSRSHYAIGRIDYGNGQEGLLLYIKPSITGDETEYIYDYRAKNMAFPHESTTDQFFTEPQFEAYRSLGEHSLEHLSPSRPPKCVEDWFENADAMMRFNSVENQSCLAV
jgi:hypothetical protein